MTIKRRESLKQAFRSGAIPTQDDFACLIDSLSHVDDIQPLSQQVAGLETMAKRLEQEVQTPAEVELDADGTWQVLLRDVDALDAFSVLARIDKSQLSPISAMTHAVAVFGAAGSRPRVRQTRSFSIERYWTWAIAGLSGTALIAALAPLAFGAWTAGGPPHVAIGRAVRTVLRVAPTWTLVAVCVLTLCLLGIAVCLYLRNRRAITVAWRHQGGLSSKQAVFDLMIRTGLNYGSKRDKVTMSCQLRRLWS